MQNSNTLSVQNEFPLEKVITTKELAKSLGVTLRTVQQIIADKGYEINFVPMQTKGGIQKCACVNEAQATAIKIELQNHSKIAKNGFDTLSVSNDLEGELLVKRAMAYQDQKIRELQKRAEVAENALDRIANGKDCYTMGATAKALHINVNGKKLGRNNFIDFLKDKNILMENGEPYQNHTEHFKTVIKFINEQIGNRPVTLTTGKGLVYLAKKFNTTIDESVLPDAE